MTQLTRGILDGCTDLSSFIQQQLLLATHSAPDTVKVDRVQLCAHRPLASWRFHSRLWGAGPENEKEVGIEQFRNWEEVLRREGAG